MKRHEIGFLLSILAVGILAATGCDSRTPTPPPTPPVATPSPTPTAADIAQRTATASPSVSPQPSATPTPTPCLPPEDWVPYVVERGDTLYSLGLPYGLTAEELQAYNCLPSADQIRAGQTLYVPWYVTPTPVPPTPCSIRVGWVPYTVQYGENLYRIALRHELSVAELQAGNCLDSDQIQEGQTLYVPYLIPTSSLPSPPAPGGQAAAIPTPPSPGGTPIPYDWSDNFDQPNWPLIDGATGATRYQDEQYYLTLRERGAWFAVPAGQKIEDLTIAMGQITPLVSPAECPALAFGVVCRYRDRDNYYAFLLTAGGEYAILRLEAGQAHYLLDWTVDDTGLIKDQLEMGRVMLTAQCQGQELVLDFGADPVSEPAVDLAAGDFGLIVGTRPDRACDTTSDLEVVFDTMRVNWRED